MKRHARISIAATIVLAIAANTAGLADLGNALGTILLAALFVIVNAGTIWMIVEEFFDF